MPKQSKDRANAAATAALLEIHRGLFPENYDASIEEPSQWDAGTIEWVAADIEAALRGHPSARFTQASA